VTSPEKNKITSRIKAEDDFRVLDVQNLSKKKIYLEEKILNKLVCDGAPFDDVMWNLMIGRKTRVIIEYFNCPAKCDGMVWIRRKRNIFHIFPPRITLFFDSNMALLRFSIKKPDGVVALSGDLPAAAPIPSNVRSHGTYFYRSHAYHSDRVWFGRAK
jgi:hypothetical protein